MAGRRHTLARSGAIAAAALAVAASLATAAAGGTLPKTPVAVSPASGSPGTTFTVAYRTVSHTGRVGASIIGDEVQVTSSGGMRGCIPSASASAPAAAKGALVRVRLVPESLGGAWCSGTYRGRIVETARPYCAPGKLCPQFIVLRGTLGTFTLTVR